MGVGCSHDPISKCDIWGGCNLECDRGQTVSEATCLCPQGSLLDDDRGHCVIPTTDGQSCSFFEKKLRVMTTSNKA